jgi:predicted nucleic acid-binding protein
MIDRAVVNAGPLVALSLLGRLDLLPALCREIWIPDTVHQEVSAGLGRPGADALQDGAWLRRVKVAPTPDPLLVTELDPGEAAVISLARHMSPCVAIIDERRGRRIAADVYRLTVKGTVGMLAEARRRGLIDALRPLLMTLKESGYFISSAVIDAACQSVGE